MELARKDENIISWMMVANHLTEVYLDKKYEKYGIKGLQHAYVTIVARNPGIEQKKLVDFFMVNPSNITRNLAVLEKNDFLERKRDEKDHRVWRLYPTEKTLKLYDELVEVFDGWQKEVLSEFSPDEIKQFSIYLRKVSNKLKKYGENI